MDREDVIYIYLWIDSVIFDVIWIKTTNFKLLSANNLLCFFKVIAQQCVRLATISANKSQNSIVPINTSSRWDFDRGSYWINISPIGRERVTGPLDQYLSHTAGHVNNIFICVKRGKLMEFQCVSPQTGDTHVASTSSLHSMNLRVARWKSCVFCCPEEYTQHATNGEEREREREVYNLMQPLLTGASAASSHWLWENVVLRDVVPLSAVSR